MRNEAGTRIVRAEQIVIDWPLTRANQIWNGSRARGWERVQLVHLETAANEVFGWGEAPFGYLRDTTSYEIDQLIGRNAADLLSDDGLPPALSMAIHDLVSRALDIPLSGVLGAKRVRETCALSWWSTAMPPADVRQEAEAAHRLGYRSHKLKARPWFDIRDQLSNVSDAVGDDFQLDLDWNQFLLTPKQANATIRELAATNQVGIVESPIRHGDLAGYREVTGASQIPIAEHLGEGASRDVMLSSGAYDGFVLEGGIRRILADAYAAHLFNKPVWVQLVGTELTTALALHLTSVIPNATWPVVSAMNVYQQQLGTEPIELRDGFATVPTGPGLGAQPDRDVVERQRCADPSIPSPGERGLWSVEFPSGHRRWYADREQLTEEFLLVGYGPDPFGMHTTRLFDDGSREFDAFYRKAAVGAIESASGP